MLQRLLRRRKGIDYHRLVSVCYEIALGRKADQAGLESYVGQLRSGSIDVVDLLEALTASDEFSARNKAYEFRDDEFIKKFLTKDVIHLSEVLEKERPIGSGDYGRCFDHIFARSPESLIIGQKEYGIVHKKRFYELINALHILGVNREDATVLEFGASEFSAIYPMFFSNLSLDIADRPVPEDFIGFTSTVALGRLKARNYFNVDLNQPHLFLEYARVLPRYSHIIFCEVLEHLVVNPIEVFTFLIGLLRDDGLIYLTTPNFFSYKNLQRMGSWENPQEVYPAANGNWDAHFHHREFSLKELLRFAESSGGVVKAFYHSDCLDSEPETAAPCPAMRGNLVLVIGNR